MKVFRRTTFVLILLYSLQQVFAQSTKDSLDLVYHLDPILYNGKQYTFFVSKNMRGNQYFIDTDFTKGNVQINGVKYTDLNFNYDIYNQQFVVKFIKPNGITVIIEIPKSRLEEFEIKKIQFEVLKGNNQTENIYQVLGTGSAKILFYWQKRLNLDDASGAILHVFSKKEKETFIYINKQLNKYRNNKGFVSVFKPVKQAKIKKYMKEHKINVKKATDDMMIDLIIFCNKSEL